MKTKLKLMTILGTRPEIIKLSEVIKRADQLFEHVLVHTGQNYDYELNEVFFSEMEIRRPDYYLGVVGANLGDTLGNVLSKSYDLMREVRPDALLVLGDTNSCLAVISAKRLKIPIFHLEAGNRCFDENLPEEVNRRIVDTSSDINFCYSEAARHNLAATGFPPQRTFVVGSPMREVIDRNGLRIEQSDVVAQLGLTQGGYILLSAHREENVDSERNLLSIVSAINALAEEYRMPILFSMHPRSARVIEQRKVELHELVCRHKPFGFASYMALQRNAFCVVSDSGTLAEESSIVGFPAVSLRTSTERPEAIDSGRMTLAGISASSICQAVALTVATQANVSSEVHDYADSDTSMKVCRIIQGYTSYVNDWVWRKDR